MKAAALLLFLAAACGTDSPEASLASLRTVEEFAVTADSVRIFYRVVGSGPETVLAPHAHLHGTRLDALASDGRRVVLYDQRGRGRSDSVPAEKTRSTTSSSTSKRSDRPWMPTPLP